MKKIYIQIIDTKTGVYQFAKIEEPVIKNHETKNALGHFGIKESEMRWLVKREDICYGEVVNTSKVVTVTIC